MVDTYLGMDQSLALVYYVFYCAEVGTGNTITGLGDLNAAWRQILETLGKSDDENENTLGNILAGILDKDFDDVLSSEGVATNGFISFFQRLADIFNKILDFFRGLFN